MGEMHKLLNGANRSLNFISRIKVIIIDEPKRLFSKFNLRTFSSRAYLISSRFSTTTVA